MVTTTAPLSSDRTTGDPGAAYAAGAEHRVAMAVFALQAAVTDLWSLRMNPETADQVLIEEGSLLASRGSLHVLVDDIRKSNDNHTRSSYARAV